MNSVSLWFQRNVKQKAQHRPGASSGPRDSPKGMGRPPGRPLGHSRLRSGRLQPRRQEPQPPARPLLPQAAARRFRTRGAHGAPPPALGWVRSHSTPGRAGIWGPAHHPRGPWRPGAAATAGQRRHACPGLVRSAAATRVAERLARSRDAQGVVRVVLASLSPAGQ